jgi:hypothetical protein
MEKSRKKVGRMDSTCGYHSLVQQGRSFVNSEGRREVGGQGEQVSRTIILRSWK